MFVVSLAGVLPVEHLIDRIVMMLSRVAPGDVVRIAQQQFAQIARQPHGGVLTRIQERRSWWRVRLTAVALTITLTIVTLVAFALVMAGPAAAGYAAEWLALGPEFLWAWNILRWPVAFALVVSAIGCIYHFAPDTTSPCCGSTSPASPF